MRFFLNKYCVFVENHTNVPHIQLIENYEERALLHNV